MQGGYKVDAKLSRRATGSGVQLSLLFLINYVTDKTRLQDGFRAPHSCLSTCSPAIGSVLGRLLSYLLFSLEFNQTQLGFRCCLLSC
jgi:hypothetical protein